MLTCQWGPVTIHLRVISQERLQPSINKNSLEITNLKLLQIYQGPYLEEHIPKWWHMNIFFRDGINYNSELTTYNGYEQNSDISSA